MKQYLAVETLESYHDTATDDFTPEEAQYEFVFSAFNDQAAEDHIENYKHRINESTELCGEITETYVVS